MGNFSDRMLTLIFAFLTLTSVAAPQGSPAGGKPSGLADYSVMVLGDTHYDSDNPEKFHAQCIKNQKGNLKPNLRSQFARNVKMWAGPSQRMLEASAKCVSTNTVFALQLGDLIQGDCDSAAVHTQYLAEATALLESTYPGLPIVTVCGNHDIRDSKSKTGAAKTYCQFMFPYLTRQLSALGAPPVTRTTFGFRLGPDLWIFADFNVGARDLGVIKKLLAANEDARYTFFCSHGPVIPSDVSSKNYSRRWFFLGAPQNDEQRRKMRALFAKRNMIVLCGHLHVLEYKDWFGDGGRITEMVLSSMITRTEAEPQVVFDSPAKYGDWPEGTKKTAETDAIDALFDEYHPGLKERYAAKAGGHYVLHVSDSGVTVDYYGLDTTTPTKTFKLR